MKEERKTEIKVGITVLAAVILFIWILGWAKNFTFSEKHYEIRVGFNSVAGLSEGDQVTINGVKKGYVEKIELIDNDAITTLKIENDVVLYSDAKFSVMMLDLMGGKKVEINPGASGLQIDLSESHNGRFLGDISSAMAALSSVEGDVIILIREVKDAVEKMNSRYLSGDFHDRISNTLSNTDRLLSNINDLITNNSDAISSVLVKTDTLLSSTNNLMSSSRDSIAKAIENLNHTLKVTSGFVDAVSELIAETRDKRNNLGKALYDDKLLDNLEKTLKDTNELLKILLDQIKNEGINVDANIF
ncbi:MAG: MCE family protein [Melioribacteraceae bacterium]|nr:MCE family protein [Melioribacteraceae bacterium]